MIKPSYCHKCGAGLPADSQFCPSCGAAQHTTGHSPTSQPSQPSYEQPGMGTGRLPPGRVLHARYRLLEKVGQGGMGAVYVAQDTQLGERLVAVKEMSMSRLAPQDVPQAVELFKREAHLLASLHHINLPVIYDHFGEENRWYLVMSFIQGGTLQAYLDAAPGKKLPGSEVIRIGIDLCNVLDYLHNHQPQIIFRDLKPLNIMLTPQGQVYLIDFGIARHFKQDQSKDTAYYYSAGYAPPEQYGQSQTGPRSDIYSLGATLHQMFSGHNPASRPFHFPALQLLDPTMPVALAKLIAQMLEMNEEQRPPSMAAVRAELEKARNPAPIPPTSQVDYAEKKPAQVEQARTPNPAASGVPEAQAKKPPAQESKKQPSSTPRTRTGSISLWWLVFSAAMLLAGLWSILGPTPNSLPDGNVRIPFISLLLAALVGLVLLLTKGRRRVNMPGGVALLLLGDSILLLTHQVYSGSDYYLYPDPYTADLGLAEVIVNFGSILLIGLGAYCFSRPASKRQGIIFGIGVTILGAFLSLLWTQRLNWSWLPFVSETPPVALWIWLGQALLGIVLFVRALATRTNSLPEQTAQS